MGDRLDLTLTVASRGGLAQGVVATVSPSANVTNRLGYGSWLRLRCRSSFRLRPRLPRATRHGSSCSHRDRTGACRVMASARARQADANPADNDATLRIEAAALSPAPRSTPPRCTADGPQGHSQTGHTPGHERAGQPVRVGGRDVLYGLSGPDTLVGGTGADRLFAGAGNETILARDRARDTIVCGSGRDLIGPTRLIALPATANASFASVDSGCARGGELGEDRRVDRVRQRGFAVEDVGAGASSSLSGLAAPLDRDHGVERAVRDRDRIPSSAVRSSSSPGTLGMKPDRQTSPAGRGRSGPSPSA